MRSVLLKQVRPLVELFTAELVDLVTSRIEADLAHVGEILEYSLSAIASDLGAPPEDQAPTARREEGFDVGSMIRVDAKARGFRKNSPPRVDRDPKPANALQRVEAVTIAQTLEANDGNVSAAARELGIHRQSLQRKIKKQANGKAWPSCSICKKEGVTARTHPAHVDGTAGDADSDQERRRGRGASKRRQAWGDAARGHAGLEWIDCADGTRRPVEPGIKPLAHGAPARVGLRGYGNGLVSEQAVAFIEAALEAGEAVIR